MSLHRLFGPVALVAAALGLWVLFVGPSVDPFGGGQRVLSQEPVAYTAWAWGLLMGLALAWLAAKDWGQFPGGSSCSASDWASSSSAACSPACSCCSEAAAGGGYSARRPQRGACPKRACFLVGTLWLGLY